MAATARAVAAALISTGVAAAVLAIIAGIFGMHVMTGNHAAHGNHKVHAAVVLSTAVHAEDQHTGAGHAEDGHTGAGHAEDAHTGALPADPATAPTPVPGVSSCGGSCQDMQESGVSCVPAAKAGSLKVFPPHETGIVLRYDAGACPDPVAVYSHTPPGPTPCELSISRT